MNRRNFLRNTTTVAIIAPIVATAKIITPEEGEWCVTRGKTIMINCDRIPEDTSAAKIIYHWRESGFIPGLGNQAIKIVRNGYLNVVKRSDLNHDIHADIMFSGTIEECNNWIHEWHQGQGLMTHKEEWNALDYMAEKGYEIVDMGVMSPQNNKI